MFLSDKVVVLNGASSEIGVAIARELLENGAVVLGTYNKHKTRVANLVKTYGSKRFICSRVDFLSKEWLSEIGNIISRVKTEFGRIDILINVSGIWLVKPFLYEEREEIEAIWRINYWAPYYFMQKSIPHMMQNGGHIINIASTSGTKGMGQQVTYAATKAALINLTQSVAEEFAPRAIRVNAISPGPTDTAALSRYFDESMKKLLIKHIPLNKLCQPSDVANATLGILANEYITGVNIALHGGRL
jgi:3-oxoacyl-[acyl-carrier protein] reductase